MKYCSYCGNEMNDEAVVCVKCGASVEEVVPATPVIKKMCTMSIVAFIFSFISPIVGVILGSIANGKINKDPTLKGKGFAMAAIGISIANWILNMIVIFSMGLGA